MMNLKTNTKENISEQYIIDVNKTLRKENAEQIKTIEKLESQVADLEDSNDNSDKRNDYLKNVLKNFHEMNKLYKELYESRKYRTVLCEERITDRRKDAKGTLRLCESLVTIFLGYRFWSCGFYALFTSPNIVIIGLMLGLLGYFEKILDLYRTPQLPKHKSEEKEILKKIKRINKAQDYIYEFIDNI